MINQNKSLNVTNTPFSNDISMISGNKSSMAASGISGGNKGSVRDFKITKK
jgi:hypothetical protein